MNYSDGSQMMQRNNAVDNFMAGGPGQAPNQLNLGDLSYNRGIGLDQRFTLIENSQK